MSSNKCGIAPAFPRKCIRDREWKDREQKDREEVEIPIFSPIVLLWAKLLKANAAASLTCIC